MKTNDRITECCGLYIEYNFYSTGEYTVQYCGDDIMFETKEDAIKFCREVSSDEN